MMKRFFFRSSTSSNGKRNALPPPFPDKEVNEQDEGECGNHIQASKKAQYSSESFKCSHFKTQNPLSGNECLEANKMLRRSHSFSSAAFHESVLGQGFSCLSDQSDSPSSSGSSVQTQNCNHTSRHRALTPVRHTKAKRSLTPVRHTKAKRSEAVTFKNSQHSGSTRVLCDSSRTSSTSSGNDSRVLDLYIDGEQQEERTGRKNEASHNDRARKDGGKRPPRNQRTAPPSPTGSGSISEKPVSNSFRCSKEVQKYFSPRGWVESGFEHDLSQDIAKHVVKRLSEFQLKNHDPDVPISIEDVYAGSLDGGFGLRATEIDQEGFCTNVSENPHFLKDCSGYEENDGNFCLTTTGDDVDAELRLKLREMEEKIFTFSDELEQENFLGDVEFNVPELVKRIRSLTEEKISLALEISVALRKHIDERLSIKDELKAARQELNSRVRRLEREKSELQSTLEKELDRRSSDWSYKLEKFQEEEQRLRQRTKELAEQNVSLQREVSSLSEKETERSKMLAHFEEQIKEKNAALVTARNENQEIRHHLCELQENYKATKEERDCIRRNFEVKEDECRGLHRSITRLLRTCKEQEKTIDGLQGVVGESVEKRQPLAGFEKHLHKLQTEQVRLVGVEQALRREVESYKHEVASLRNENINLLNRLKGCGKEGGSLTFKLDQELLARLRCLQIQGLSLLAQSTNLCSLLLEQIIGRTGLYIETKDGIVIDENLDGQFVVDCNIKIQGLRRGTESLSRSLETVSSVLHEKSILVSSESQAQNQEDDVHGQPNEQLQDMTRSKLKAEMLLTNLLQEKLYAKNLEVEQLQAELATAARGNDVLRCELQNALDTISSTTYKMKDLELQMLNRDEKINQLESNLEECTKELAVARGILPKVTEERDMMWKEVKQYSEKNMLLHSEVNSLKKRIEELDEAILLKDGQISILKDSLGKPFDLLSSSDHTEEFELE